MIIRRLFLAAFAAAVALTAARGQERVDKPIDQTTLRRLSTRNNGEPLDDVLLWRIANNRFVDDSGNPTSGAAAVAAYVRSPYLLSVSSPNSRRRAMQVRPADGAPPQARALTVEELNRGGVVFTVLPGYDLVTFAGLQRAFLISGGRMITPAQSKIVPLSDSDYLHHRERRATAQEVFIKAQMADARAGRIDAIAELHALQRQPRVRASGVRLVKGTFTFEFDAFDSDMVEFVCVTSSGREVAFTLRAFDFLADGQS
jgi:hypothetical protein